MYEWYELHKIRNVLNVKSFMNYENRRLCLFYKQNMIITVYDSISLIRRFNYLCSFSKLLKYALSVMCTLKR